MGNVGHGSPGDDELMTVARQMQVEFNAGHHHSQSAD
jgi:hypothetical protein